ncbi:MAG: hypothetical protein AAGK17_09445, partial [Pseudomonadota bacterium]
MTLERPVFGRKKPKNSSVDRGKTNTLSSGSRIPDNERIFDAQTFEEYPFLEGLGFSPDDPSNQKPTPHTTRASIDAAYAEQISFLEGVNSQLPPGTHVAPYAMIPSEVWDGPFGAYLVGACDFMPAHPLNTMLLPADQRSSFVLDLIERPQGYPSGLV